MKKLLIASIMIVSANAMAATSLICNDQNSRAVYKISLNENNTKMTLTPILKDSSILSLSQASLRYNEGESNTAYSLYEGKNETNDSIVIELKNKTVVVGNTAEATVYYAQSDSKILNNKTTFLCEVR